jgi:hypothetical protein
VLKNVDAIELRVVVTTVLAVAADAVFAAHHLRKAWRPSAYGTGLLACVKSRAKKRSGGGEIAGDNGRGGAEKREKLRVNFCHGKQEIPVVRARVFFTTPTFRALGAVQSALGMGGCGCDFFLQYDHCN